MRFQRAIRLVAVLGTFATLASARPLDSLKMGVALYHMCYLEEDEGQIQGSRSSVTCYDEKGNPLPVPATLDSPTGIAVGYRMGGGGAGRERSYSCAIQSGGVLCWGSLGDRLNRQFQKVREPYLIAAGDSDLCVADRTRGLTCYGGDHQWTRIVESQPQLGPLQELALGNYFACAITETKQIQCWGGVKESYREYIPKVLLPHLAELDTQMKTPPAGLASPHSLSVGLSHACVLNRNSAGANEKHCWGVMLKDQNAPHPDQKRLEWAQAGLFRTFGIADSKVFVLGQSEEWERTLIDTGSSYPRLVSTSKTDYPKYYSVCVATDALLTCRGAIHLDKETPVNGFQLQKFENTLNRIRNYVYRPKAEVLDEVVSLARTLAADEGQTRRFLLNVIDPLMESTSSQVFIASLVPKYRDSLKFYNTPAIFSLRDTGMSAWHVRASLRLLYVCFTSLSEYRMATRDLMPALGIALGKAHGPAIPKDEVAQVVSEIGKLQDTLSAVARKPRTLGIVGMIQTLNEYLKGGLL